MHRVVIAVLAFASLAHADNAVALEGNAMLNIAGPMAGGSIAYEYRDGDGAFTARAGAATGQKFDGGAYQALTGVIGYRHYWSNGVFLEIEGGYLGYRQARYNGDFGAHVGTQWTQLPQGQLTFGGKAGPVRIGVYTDAPLAGIGVELGFDFARW